MSEAHAAQVEAVKSEIATIAQKDSLDLVVEFDAISSWPADKYTDHETVQKWAGKGALNDIKSLVQHLCKDEPSRQAFAAVVDTMRVGFGSYDTSGAAIEFADGVLSLVASINLDSSWSPSSGLVGSSEKDAAEAFVKTPETAAIIVNAKAESYAEKLAEVQAQISELAEEPLTINVDWENLIANWPWDKYTKPEFIVDWVYHGALNDIVTLVKHCCRDVPSKVVFGACVVSFTISFDAYNGSFVGIDFADANVKYIASINLDSSWSKGSGLVGSTEKDTLEGFIKTPDTAELLIVSKHAEYLDQFDETREVLVELTGNEGIEFEVEWEAMYAWPTDKYTKPESIVTWAAYGGCSDVRSLVKHMCRDDASRAVFSEVIDTIKLRFDGYSSSDMQVEVQDNVVYLTVSINLDSSWSQGSGLVGSSEKDALESQLKTSDTAGLLIDTKAKEYADAFAAAKAELEEIVGHDINLDIDWSQLKSWKTDQYTKPEDIVTWTSKGAMNDLKTLAKHVCRDEPSKAVFASVCTGFLVSFGDDSMSHVEVALEGSVVTYTPSIQLSSSWSAGSGLVGSSEKDILEVAVKNPSTLPLLISAKATADDEIFQSNLKAVQAVREDINVEFDWSGLEQWPTDQYTKPELIVSWAFKGAMSDIKTLTEHLMGDEHKATFTSKINKFVVAFNDPSVRELQASKDGDALVYTASIQLSSSWSASSGMVGSSEKDAFATAMTSEGTPVVATSSSSGSSSGGRGRAFSVINVDYSKADGVDGMKEHIIQAFIPAAEQRIKHCCGANITFEVDWDSFENTKNLERAVKSLWSWNGYFLFTRTAVVVEDICENSYGADDVAARLKKIIVSHESEVEEDDKIKFDGTTGVLALKGDFNFGSAGAYSKKKLRLLIRKVLGLTSKYYVRRINDESVPRFKSRTQEIVGKEVEVTVDWDSFEKALDQEDAFYYLAAWSGYYSFDRVVSGLRRAVERGDQLTFKEMLHKVVFRHIPGRDYRKRRVYITEGTLYVCGVFETYWGCPGYWDVSEVLYHYYKFASMPAFLDLEQEEHEEKLDLWKDACTSTQVTSGDVGYVARLLENKCFYQLNDHDKNALEKFTDDNLEEDEIVIRGWPINKINFRGQEQDRMLVLTDKAVYTFAYDYEKSKVDEKRVHRYDHEDYLRNVWGELKGSDISVPGDVPGSSAMAAAANAAADFLGTKRYGFHYQTDKLENQKNLLGSALGKLGLGKKVLELMQKMVDTLLEGKEDDLPEFSIPQLPIWTPEKLSEVALKSMGESDEDLPSVELSGLPPATPVECLLVLQEAFEAMGKKQPRIKLDNMPKISVPYLLNASLEVLINSDDEIELPLPQGEPNLMEMLKDLVGEVVKSEDWNPMPLPPIEDISLKAMLEGIRAAIVEKELETIDQRLPSLGDLPPVVEHIDQLCAAIGDDVIIKFPELPGVPVEKVLKKMAEVLSDVSLPSFDMSGFDFGIDMPKVDMPKVDMPKVDMPKVDMPKIDMPSLPGGGLKKKMKKLVPPPKPKKLEMLVQPLVLDEHNNEKEGTDLIVAQEISWAIYGVTRAAVYPWYVYRPWETSSISLPESYMATVYNKGNRGKSNAPYRQ